jgi:hypothetical protein
MSAVMRGKELKKHLEALITTDSFANAPESVLTGPLKQSINVMFSFFCSLNPLIKWRAVTGAGILVSELSKDRMEDARIIMRRLMWMLNEESGGIGWGAPEAMGEIMARCPALALEFNRILISYIDEGGNFLEHEPLQDGVLWGIGRVSEQYPDLMKPAAPLSRPFLISPDPVKRGLACIISGLLHDIASRDSIEKLLMDKTTINLYRNMSIDGHSISSLAEDALNYLS